MIKLYQNVIKILRFQISNKCHPQQIRAPLHETRSVRLHGSFTVVNLEISNSFQKLLRLHGDFTAATFQTIARF